MQIITTFSVCLATAFSVLYVLTYIGKFFCVSVLETIYDNFTAFKLNDTEGEIYILNFNIVVVIAYHITNFIDPELFNSTVTLCGSLIVNVAYFYILYVTQQHSVINTFKNIHYNIKNNKRKNKK